MKGSRCQFSATSKFNSMALNSFVASPHDNSKFLFLCIDCSMVDVSDSSVRATYLAQREGQIQNFYWNIAPEERVYTFTPRALVLLNVQNWHQAPAVFLSESTSVCTAFNCTVGSTPCLPFDPRRKHGACRASFISSFLYYSLSSHISHLVHDRSWAADAFSNSHAQT